MFRRVAFPLFIGVLVFLALPAYSETGPASEKIPVLRKAQERGEANVAVDAYLAGDILEVKVFAGMYQTKPQINNCILVGPKLGRLSAQQKETIYPKAEDELKDDIFSTEDMQGDFLRFSKKVKEKQIGGALTRELYRFKIPADKIMPGRRYELRIRIESMQNPGKFEKFTFELNGLPELLLKKQAGE